MPFSLAKRLWPSLFNRSPRRPKRTSRPRRHGVALGLEALEERWLPNATVITVTTAADDPTTPIAGQTTLRDAINQANQTTGATIVFAPSVGGQTIQPLAALPLITGAGTTIDGVGMNITLDGSHATSPVPDVYLTGLNVQASSLTLLNYRVEAVELDASIGSRELPLHFDLTFVPLQLPRPDFLT